MLPFTILGIARTIRHYQKYTKLDKAQDVGDKMGPSAKHNALRTLFFLLVWVISGYSLLSHKEFRFIQPLLPIFIMFTSFGITQYLSSRVRISKLLLVLLVVTNLPVGIYMSLIHQRGVVDVMSYLRKEAQNGRVSEIGFLMPCHSTPGYCNLHVNVPIWFLTCEPPIEVPENELDNYMDESDMFYADPVGFLQREFDKVPRDNMMHVHDSNKRKWPSHLVMFENLMSDIGTLLTDSSYHEVFNNANV
ncbi:1966_t:CDS:2 [Paraglomus occultum]|uniref:Mannosyltransferase n=1 Tax=Paraglomus occultum TaxID=144539 RepID=A0A9N9B4R7_9GLOM|nr:1966_t:CDS:2 [Paraglomus occultum]